MGNKFTEVLCRHKLLEHEPDDRRPRGI